MTTSSMSFGPRPARVTAASMACAPSCGAETSFNSPRNPPIGVRAAEDISAKSPTALKVTRALLLRAAGAPDVETCLTNEFKAACRMLATHDLYEGIRAAIIDKDRRPRWSPDRLDAVSDETVEVILAGDDMRLPAFKSWDSSPYSRWER